MWGPLSYSVFGQIFEFNSHNSKLKNISYKLWKLKTHFLCFQVKRIEFQWQSYNYSTTVGPVAMSGHIRPVETIGFTLFSLFHLLFFSDTTLFTLKASHTHILL